MAPPCPLLSRITKVAASSHLVELAWKRPQEGTPVLAIRAPVAIAGYPTVWRTANPEFFERGH